MFNTSNLFDVLFVIPILNALAGLYNLFGLIHLPGALGFALIALTVIIRLILSPLTAVQMKSAQKMNKLKPELDKLAKQFKDDKSRHHQEQLKLYQEAGINPASGCLPLLVQMPVLIALYNLFFKILGNDANMAAVIAEINKVVYFSWLRLSSLDLSFFGISLVQKPSQWQTQGFWLLAIPVLTALLQYWQTRLMTPPAVSPVPVNGNKESGKKGEEDMSMAMQKQMSVMMPLMIGFFAYSFPIGLALYWNTITVFGIIQQYQINKAVEKYEKK